MLTEPKYISEADEKVDKIPFSWPDKDAEDIYIAPDERLRGRMAKTSPKGVLAIALGCSEWIAWRLGQFGRSRPLLDLVEAIWAAQCDWRYLRISAMLDPREWSAPTERPLITTFSLLVEVATHVHRNEASTPEVVCLVKICEYVTLNKQAFSEWKRDVIKRLSSSHPRGANSMNQGAAVPREAVDPTFNYTPSLAPDLLSSFIRTLDHHSNPYLRPPESMLEKGFTGQPYAGC